MIPDFVIL